MMMKRLFKNALVFSASVFAVAGLAASCTELKAPEPKPYFAETRPPRSQEFRWSNGRSPRSLDPAKAAAAPETDIARALFEGLTDLDPKTLEAVPAIAESWDHSEDLRIWNFHLRSDAVWSNGEPVTAYDFVRSWKRLNELGDEAAHRSLLLNIKGFSDPVKASPAESRPKQTTSAAGADPDQPHRSAENSATDREKIKVNDELSGSRRTYLGVTAANGRELTVELVHPDKDLPKLLAHPIFRPVFENDAALGTKNGISAPITNGPFKLTGISDIGLTLDRNDSYWDRDAVKLERVQFIAAASPEKALDAYKAGELDAVTNAEFSPAAVKLFEPFEDFRRNVHSAVNLYEFNLKSEPFGDRRVRLALAISIEREKLTEGELEGTTRPANGFLPFGSGPVSRFQQDVQRARDLLDEAGFPQGAGFPVIRLLVNRNDAQIRIAKSVAAMWKANLNVSTQIIVREASEIESAVLAGEYDAVRRGMVLPVSDETADLLSIFHSRPGTGETDPIPSPAADARSEFKPGSTGPGPGDTNGGTDAAPTSDKDRAEAGIILSEADAVYEMRAIPLYFPTSYSLVKPYVKGFDSNPLDSPQLKNVEIDRNWQTK